MVNFEICDNPYPELIQIEEKDSFDKDFNDYMLRQYEYYKQRHTPRRMFDKSVRHNFSVEIDEGASYFGRYL